jgi:hypothetical protein
VISTALSGATARCQSSHSRQPSGIVSASSTSRIPVRCQWPRHHSAECEVDPGGQFDPSAMESLDLAEARSLLGDLLEQTFGSLADVDDLRVLIAAARARVPVDGS